MGQLSKSANGRINWIDYAKGFGIFFVVVIHVINGLINAGIITDPFLMHLGESWFFYSFDMVIFFTLSGLFISRSVRKPLREFLNTRLRLMIYPYVLWSLISLVLGTIMVNQTNSGLSLTGENLLRIVIDPILHFWFIYALFILVMLYIIMGKLNLKPIWFFMVIFVVFCIGQITWHLGLTDDLPYYLWGILQYSIFFALGTQFSDKIRTVPPTAPMRTLSFGAVICLGVWVFFVLNGVDFALAWLRPVVALVGGMGIFFVCMILARLNAFPIIKHWGLLSLEIYLAHVMAATGFRIIVWRVFGIESTAIHLIGGVLFGFFAPLALYYLADKVNFVYLYSWPKSKSSVPTMPPAMATSSVER